MHAGNDRLVMIGKWEGSSATLPPALSWSRQLKLWSKGKGKEGNAFKFFIFILLLGLLLGMIYLVNLYYYKFCATFLHWFYCIFYFQPLQLTSHSMAFYDMKLDVFCVWEWLKYWFCFLYTIILCPYQHWTYKFTSLWRYMMSFLRNTPPFFAIHREYIYLGSSKQNIAHACSVWC